MPNYAIELQNDGLHCGFWHYPVHAKSDDLRRGRDMPQSKPLNADPLVFETLVDAAVALEFYWQVWGSSHIDAKMLEVEVDATHTLGEEGFETLPMKDGLFAQTSE